jgi:hypothetical protein
MNETHMTQCDHYFHQKCFEEHCSVPGRLMCLLCKIKINFQIPLSSSFSSNYPSSQTSTNQGIIFMHLFKMKMLMFKKIQIAALIVVALMLVS